MGLDFNALLEPYKEGGTESDPVERNIGTITDYLLTRKKYSYDIVGKAIFKVFIELSNGLEFEGDGSYGSKGREMVTYLRKTCDLLNHKELKVNIEKFILEKNFCGKVDCKRRSFEIRKRRTLKTMLTRKKKVLSNESA